MGIRINGFDTPVGGVSWEFTKRDVDCAFRIIKYLENRRVLYNPQYLEIPKYCVNSVYEIREYLTKELQNNSKEMKINDDIEQMRIWCRSFINKVENEAFLDHILTFKDISYHDYYKVSRESGYNHLISEYPDDSYLQQLQRHRIETTYLLALAVFRKNMLDLIVRLSHKYKIKVCGELSAMIKDYL